jgi:hypothetical protein
MMVLWVQIQQSRGLVCGKTLCLGVSVVASVGPDKKPRGEVKMQKTRTAPFTETGL